MDPSHFEAKSFLVDHTVESLGLVFVALPPLPPPAVVVKQVHEDTWAATAGIQPGCEVVELGGNMVGAMTGEEFEAAISQRPLRIRVLPPNAAVWQQVAHFQKQVVRLSFQKVLLQKALRDEHDNLKKELGIDSDVEAKQKARASLARADIAGQRTQLERRKQEVAKQEAELETKREEAAAFDQETQTRRKALKADMAHLASQQAELEKARHDFDTMRKTKLEALEKERQLLSAERTELEAKRDEVLVEQSEREDLDAEWQRLREEREEFLSQKAELESFVQKAQGQFRDLDEERLALARSREELEDDVMQMSQAKSELQAQRSRDAAFHENLEKEALAFKEACNTTRMELEAERMKLQTQQQTQQAQLQKEREEFKAKCKHALQQLEARKRQLLQLQKQLAAEKLAAEQARKDQTDQAEHTQHKEQKDEATQVEACAVVTVEACAQACPESSEVQVQTVETLQTVSRTLPRTEVGGERGEHDPTLHPAQGAWLEDKAPQDAGSRGRVTTEVLMDADRLRAVDLTAHVHTLLQARKVDAHCMRNLSQLLQDMVRSPREGSELPSESASTSKLKQKGSDVRSFRALRPQSESPRPRPLSKDSKERPWRPVGHRPSPASHASPASPASPAPQELPRHEGVAKKALAQTADVRRLLAEELRKPKEFRNTSRSQSKPRQDLLRSASRAKAERPFGASLGSAAPAARKS